MFPGIGNLPVQLANNPSFISTAYGMGGGVDGGNIEKPDDVGNLNESQAPEQMANQLATNEITRTAILAELKRWRKVAKRSLRDSGSPLAKTFATNIIPQDMYVNIIKDLTTHDIDDVFEEYRNQVDVITGN